MAICHRAELRIYNNLGGGTPVTIPATDVKWSVGLGGSGFLSASVAANAAPLAATPTLLDDCVIKVAVPLAEPGTSLTEVAAFANRGRSGVLWSGAGEQTRQIRQAPTLFTVWSQDAVLFPESNAISQMMADKRYFGWMSTIYDPADDPGRWGTPSANAGKQSETTGVRAGNPDGWPTELGDAYWITRGTTANGTRHLFIADCVVPTACYLTVYFSADETCAVYFGGSRILDPSASETGYTVMSTWSAWVAAGRYRVGIDKTSVISRGGDGRDPVLLAVARNLDDGSVDTSGIFLVTNTTDWQIYTTDPVSGTVPSLTPGAIVAELASQAVARGVDTWAALTLGFDADVDSAGITWPQREERDWRVVYDKHLDMIEGLGDTGLACEITPALVLEGWSKQGTDRSGTVTLATLDEVDQVDESGVGIAASYMPVETEDGWVVVESATADAAVGRREVGLSLGNAPSIAQGRMLGQKVLDSRLSVPETEWTVQFYARTGSVPFVNFFLGDTVMVSINGTPSPRVILDLAAEQEHVEGIIRWTAKTGDVTRVGRFATEPSQALAEGGVGSMVGDPVGGAAIFATLAGVATAAGGVGSMTGLASGGAAIFTTQVGAAAAVGAAGSMTGAATFATTEGDSEASGGTGSLVSLVPGTFTTTVGTATASGGVGSLGGGVDALWQAAVIAYDWSDWVTAYESAAQGDMADDASTLVASEVWQ